MLLVIDIGNSDITIGLHNDEIWIHRWRIPTIVERPEIFYGVRLGDFFLEAGLKVSVVDKVVLSSVVPDMTDKIVKVVQSLFSKQSIVLGPDLYKKLPIDVLNPYEIGSDLVSNALAAHFMVKKNCVVVDFGTALTFTGVSADGKILGVAIAPGIKTAFRALSQNTAKLFDVPVERPNGSLGVNTVKAIQAGVMHGYEGMVRHMLIKTKAEIGTDTVSIATGGLSVVVTHLHDAFDFIEPDLTLNGLKKIAEIVAQ